MLTRVLHNSGKLCTLVDQLGLQLNVSQRRHVINVIDGLLVTDAPKTLAEIQRRFVDSVDPSDMADTFRIAPWTAQEIRQPLGAFLMQTALQHLEHTGQPRCLLINLDDSLAIRDPRTHRLEGVHWHYYHVHKRKNRTRLQNGWAYLVCTVVAGDWTFTFTVVSYLRAKTVRPINRTRPPGKRLQFVCKYRLARAILAACRALIPSDIAVYVNTDARSASARFIKYIRRQGWHSTSRVRANRTLNGKRIDQGDLAQRHRRYVQVNMSAADGSTTTYLVRHTRGRLRRVPLDVCELVSKRHYRDRLPVYFVSTALSLAPQTVLQAYARRWSCEVDNYCLQVWCGLGGYRLRPYAGRMRLSRCTSEPNSPMSSSEVRIMPCVRTVSSGRPGGGRSAGPVQSGPSRGIATGRGRAGNALASIDITSSA